MYVRPLLITRFSPNIISALCVDDILRWVLGAAGEGHPTLLSAGVAVCTVEVDVKVPVIGSKRSTTLPIFLSEVNKVLEIDVISVGSDVVVDEEVELVFNPVFKNKGKNSCCQLQEEYNPQKHREKFEKEGVLSQSSDAASKTQDKHYSAHHQKEPDRVETAKVSDGRNV